MMQCFSLYARKLELGGKITSGNFNDFNQLTFKDCKKDKEKNISTLKNQIAILSKTELFTANKNSIAKRNTVVIFSDTDVQSAINNNTTKVCSTLNFFLKNNLQSFEAQCCGILVCYFRYKITTIKLEIKCKGGQRTVVT